MKFSLSLVAVIALIALVVGVVGGPRVGRLVEQRAAAAAGGAAAGKKVDVIIKARDSSFWQTMLAGAEQGRRRLRPQGRALRPDLGDRHQPAGPARRELDLARRRRDRLAPNSSNALNSAIERARKAGIKVITADTAVTTDVEGFIGTDNVKAGEQAGKRMCELAKEAGKTSGDVMIESSVAGIQTLKDRDAGFRAGLADVPEPARSRSPRYNNNDLNTAASQVNDALTANPDLVGRLRRQQHLGHRRGPRDQGQQRRRPHPGRRLRHRPAGERGAGRRLDRRAGGAEPVLLRLPGRRGGRDGRGRQRCRR